MLADEVIALRKRVADLETRLANLELRIAHPPVVYTAPQPWQPYDGLPRSWKQGATD